MPKFSALALTLSVILLAGAGCSLSNQAQPEPQQKNIPTNTEQQTTQKNNGALPMKAQVEIVAPEEKKATVTPPSAKVKEFTMTAKNWDFEPSKITVKKGDAVKLHIKSVDVDHGFTLAAFGVSTTLKPGATETVEFIADKVGNHSFFCSVFCGAGHKEMRGTLIVTE